MDNLFLDTNIVLDLLIEREPFHIAAANVFDLAFERRVKLFATTLTFANALYVFRKQTSETVARQTLNQMRQLVSVVPQTEKDLDMAFASGFSDFEDALQYFSALHSDADIILTRNGKHFKDSALPVMTAEEYIRLQQA